MQREQRVKKICTGSLIMFAACILSNIVFAQESDRNAIVQAEPAGKVRVMVIVQAVETDISYIPIIIEAGRSVENYIENTLAGQGFTLVDATQLTALKEAEAAVRTRDAFQIATAANTAGTEILVYGEVRREFVNYREIHGTTYRFFSNELNLKAVETKTGQIIYSGMKSKNPSALEHTALLEEAAGELVSEMVPALSKQRNVNEKHYTTIYASQISFAQIDSLKRALAALEGVSTVATERFQQSVAVLRVGYQGTTEELAKKIDGISTPAVYISRMDSAAIEVMIQK